MAGQVGIPALLCYQAYGFPVDKLDYYNLPFRYEEILYIEAYSFAPDFKVLGRNGIMYWEHCGMGNYDQEDGGLDTRIIEAEIRNKLL